MARWRGLSVDDITLSGLHGQTSHSYPRNELDDILIAWSGVGAQLLVLLLALIARYFLQDTASPVVGLIAGPALMVFTLWNLFLMMVALLPIGPMDGHRAWRVIPYVRKQMQRRRRSRKVVRLDPERRRALEKKSEQMASDVIQKLGKKK
jgi:stage IV sporulation protein FB